MKRDEVPRDRVVRVVTATLLIAAISSCSERSVEAEPEPPAHRVEPCEAWCEIIRDPMCGPEPRLQTFESHAECVDFCVQDYGAHWATQPDGEDACAEEQIAYFMCVEDLECSVRAGHWDEIEADIPLAEVSCGVELDASVVCDEEK
jgi:hypothetical protein